MLWVLVLGVSRSAPLSGIVPVPPRPALPENVLPLSTSPAAAVPALQVPRSVLQVLRLLVQVVRSAWQVRSCPPCPQLTLGTLSLSGPSMAASAASSPASASLILFGSAAGGVIASIAGRTAASHCSARGYCVEIAVSTAHSAAFVMHSAQSCTDRIVPLPPKVAHQAPMPSASSGCASDDPGPRTSTVWCDRLFVVGSHACRIPAASFSVRLLLSPRLSLSCRN